MVEIPLISVPAQGFQVLLDTQECTFSLYQRNARLFMDMDVGQTRVFTGAVCLDGVNILQAAQAVFSGSLHFVDTQQHEAPQWEGLGTRWLLVYVSAGEAVPPRLQW